MKIIKYFFIIAVTVFIFAGCGADIPSGELIDYTSVAAAEQFGTLVFAKTNEQTGAVNYTDNRFSYWFNREGSIMSRTLTEPNSTQANDVSAAEAIAIAEKELIYYAGADTSLPGWEIDLAKSDASGYPWELHFKYKDIQNVVTQNHSVVINGNAEVLQMFFSREQKSEDAVIITEDEAVFTALTAISADLANSGISTTPEELLAAGTVKITEQELFAQDGNTLWHITVEGLSINGSQDKSYFVQLSATTGEVVYIENCR